MNKILYDESFAGGFDIIGVNITEEE